MRRLTGRRGSPWNLIGWLGVLTMALIVSYYVMLMAWIVAYAGILGMGKPLGSDPVETARSFTAFTTRPGTPIAIALILCVLLTAILRRGLQGGLERLAKVAMPLLVVLLVGPGHMVGDHAGRRGGIGLALQAGFLGAERPGGVGRPGPGLLFHRHRHGGRVRVR